MEKPVGSGKISLPTGHFCFWKQSSMDCAASAVGADLRGDWGVLPNKQMRVGSTHALLAEDFLRSKQSQPRERNSTALIIGTFEVMLSNSHCFQAREKEF